MTEIKPLEIEVFREKASYRGPAYEVRDDGLVKIGTNQIDFVKGDRSNPDTFRQPGLVTETVIAIAKQYLIDNNVGHLVDDDTQEAISHLEAALRCLELRAHKRRVRGVQGTYQK